MKLFPKRNRSTQPAGISFATDKTTSQASTSQLSYDEEKMLSNKLAILVNDIAIAMGKLDYGTYRGKICKTDARSMFTFSYKCEARVSVNTLATNEDEESYCFSRSSA